MAQHPAVADRRHIAVEDMQISPADRGRVHPHDDVTVVGDLRVSYLLPGLLTGTVIDQGSHGYLH
jgi:hypothetical protein